MVYLRRCLQAQTAAAAPARVDDSHVSESAASETQANRTFLEDLEKSLQEVENEDPSLRAGDNSGVIADLREQLSSSDDAGKPLPYTLASLRRSLLLALILSFRLQPCDRC